MGRVEKTIFISYRRTNIPWALAIYQNLTAHGYDVFFDYDSIASGDFSQIILSNIRARAHFLVVLTPSALERCVSPDDWLRREIETAIDEKRNIVPLFLEGFSFGSPSISDQLTGKLGQLKNYNGLNMPVDYFSEAMERIREKFLNVPLDAVLHPVSATVQKKVKKQQTSASGATQVKEKELTAQEWFEKGYKSTDSDEKIYCYSEAIRLKPDYDIAYGNRGYAIVESNGNLDLALKDLDESVRLNPNNPVVYNNRGRVYAKQGKNDKAIVEYNLSIQNDQTFHSAYYNRGIARSNKGDLDGAIKDNTEAIRLKPDDASAYYNRGIARRDKGEQDDAIKDFTEAIRHKPDHANAYFNRGFARNAKSDLDGAIKDYNEVIRLKPDYADAYNNRGIARSNKGDFDGEIKDYTEAIRLNPDYADAYYNRGNARKAKGDLDGAIKDYTEAIRIKPDYVDAYNNRGVIWDNKGDYYSAIADYQKCIDLGSRNPTIPPRIQYLRTKIK
jgi:tetratricopeptide (TPR) repeat protein